MHNPFKTSDPTVIIPMIVIIITIIICTIFAGTALLAYLGIHPLIGLALSLAGLCGLRVFFYMLKGK